MAGGNSGPARRQEVLQGQARPLGPSGIDVVGARLGELHHLGLGQVAGDEDQPATMGQAKVLVMSDHAIQCRCRQPRRYGQLDHKRGIVAAGKAEQERAQQVLPVLARIEWIQDCRVDDSGKVKSFTNWIRDAHVVSPGPAHG